MAKANNIEIGRQSIEEIITEKRMSLTGRCVGFNCSWTVTITANIPVRGKFIDQAALASEIELPKAQAFDEHNEKEHFGLASLEGL